MNLDSSEMYNFDGASRYSYLISYGHGSDTKGKRSPMLPDGRRLMEHEYVRAVGTILIRRMVEEGLDYMVINPEGYDVKVSEKSRRANKFAAKHGQGMCLLLALHGNAASYRYIDRACTVRYDPQAHFGTTKFYYMEEWHPAHGLEAFTSIGNTLADPCCQIYLETARELLPTWQIRSDKSDGDLDKEAEFWMLKHTSMPSILLEMGFYTHPEQVWEMLSLGGRALQAHVILQSLLKIEAQKVLG